MTDVEFRDWLQAEVSSGRLNSQQRDDLLEQKGHFDRQRDEIEKQYSHRIVGYVNGTREVGGTIHELMRKANERHPGRMVYFEPIGTELF